MGPKGGPLWGPVFFVPCPLLPVGAGCISAWRPSFFSAFKPKSAIGPAHPSGSRPFPTPPRFAMSVVYRHPGAAKTETECGPLLDHRPSGCDPTFFDLFCLLRNLSWPRLLPLSIKHSQDNILITHHHAAVLRKYSIIHTSCLGLGKAVHLIRYVTMGTLLTCSSLCPFLYASHTCRMLGSAG